MSVGTHEQHLGRATTGHFLFLFTALQERKNQKRTADAEGTEQSKETGGSDVGIPGALGHLRKPLNDQRREQRKGKRESRAPSEGGGTADIAAPIQPR